MNNTQVDDSREEEGKTTVSVRNITLSVWYEARHECTKRQISLGEYVSELIVKDLQLSENTSKS